MYCNGLPERNMGFIPYVQQILHMLDGECLALTPIQLTLKLERGNKMKNQETVENNEVEVARSKSKAVLHHKLSSCPQCGIGDLWAVCTVKNFETEDYSPECDYCGYVEK